MSCFPCFTSQRSKKSSSRHDDIGIPFKASKSSTKDKANQGEDKHINAQNFNFRELATATNNFRQECLLGEGGFGRVYKGTIKTSGQVVAVKQLDRNGLQGNKEFLAEVSTLSLLRHPNLVNLIGYCADGEQRLLVFEYMPAGSLEDHLLDITPDKNPLDWYTRIKIAFGIATGLEYLHETANPPIICRDLKSSNILLDDDLNPKLSDFGGGKLGLPGEKAHVSSRVMGTYGYSAPEYTRTGQLTLKSDIYSYGVVLLELITGRRSIDTTRPNDEQNLVTWAQPFFRDPKRFPDLADPLLAGQFPEKDLNQAVAIAAMCLQDEATVRPLISDVVMTLSFLSTKPPAVPVAPAPAPPPPPKDGNNEDNSSSKHQKAGSESSGESVSEGSGVPGDSGSEGSGSDSGAGSEEDEEPNNMDSKKWLPERGGSGPEEEGSESESSSSGSGSGRGSVSSRESSSGSNRPEEAGPAGGGVVSYSRKRSETKEKSMSRRMTRVGPTAAGSGKYSVAVSRNNSDVSLGMMSACHEQSFSLGSQDGFVSLHNISNMGSLDGSVHSS